jgi:hypothetical protein
VGIFVFIQWEIDVIQAASTHLTQHLNFIRNRPRLIEKICAKQNRRKEGVDRLPIN